MGVHQKVKCHLVKASTKSMQNARCVKELIINSKEKFLKSLVHLVCEVRVRSKGRVMSNSTETTSNNKKQENGKTARPSHGLSNADI